MKNLIPTPAGSVGLLDVRCSRCGRLLRDAPGVDALLWNVAARNGCAVGFLCPDCQADAEGIEAQANEAVLDYSRDSHGRMVATPKGGALDAR